VETRTWRRAGYGKGGRVLPHEQLMCREPTIASFSFSEGAGRKLKGRDLCRIYNTIWECSVLRFMLDCIPIRRECVWWRLKSTHERKTY
jgi:hypothetical protein